ncbi:MAG: RagB/SusD family nutrient uptake outer membrane protein [Dysgonomonas mossii]|uniref:RagB/SusD family nutrient uptake outer membrane protein n=1 Tax=Dysgonomonas mossii TaxID=163665 RepID=UPI0026EA2D85|nr:RagB/SusD family nutrient uptake outer membrane protein [Dysgonomonas mossii]MBS5908281.1 RagB/SusD family nutrient uptake outer membrane protein [Dysgonomonas mossii]
MKKYLIIILLGCFVMTGCDDFLNHDPKSVLTPDNGYTKPEDWQQTLNAAYGSLQEVFVGKYTITLSEFGTDEVIPFDMGWAAYAQLHHYTFSATHEFIDNHYRACYEGIKRCNAVIDMPSGAVSGDLHSSMVTQARFLRALYYFDLVRMYGGVPLWTKSSIDRDDTMKPRATVDETYTLIAEDLISALELPTTWVDAKDKGRATSLAAQAFLARVYLQWGKPDEALKYCKMLDGKFKLYDNLKDIFDPKNKNQEYENIFEVQFKHSGSWGLEGSLQHSYWGPRNVGGPTDFGGWGGFGPTQYLYDSYDNADKRKSAFFFTQYNGVVQSPPSSAKFFDSEHGNVIEDDNLNFILIRYADVLLMKAEALNATGDNNEKYTALNLVRARAGLGSITAADGLNKDQFAEVLLQERMHELCCEHMRRWDLLRFGKLAEYMKDRAGVNIQSYHVLYPLPQAAIDANDAITENNTGY